MVLAEQATSSSVHAPQCIEKSGQTSSTVGRVAVTCASELANW